ncbi:aminoacyl-tRNA hydrolase [Capnocytophaga catalasegens]|uniref:Peptidyl-tRNA hydrolase n=1 Tax=Capnocytophaga catalasegens TaxID=1004260 RepID=A0AAV5AV29_9FLAO|nr:aminoacyl-tRNA hydrolase [Capnocytophaga catalasegens]GIZ15977.1 peptidyl-tRNA hydrolase [Capnocytophaga catalasegens]GJM50464.1 peptidyl-tRNA hydrolase [Capnocytophaga catalasegens]GJM53959.1 peptidyl-tRNA hydrolase [Capnocytophaga catalasegens]
MKKFLIVGLGNIGEEYRYTRHNIGFLALDYIAQHYNAKFETQRLGDVLEIRHKGRIFILLKPSTYMNLSGKAIRYWLEKEKISLNNLLVITDDLNLPFGTLRMKKKGSDGGHNGLKNIQAELNTTEYARFRFGISDNFDKGKQIDYVLGRWSEEEIKQLPERFDKIHQAIFSFGLSGVDITMNTFNNK